MGSKGKCGSGKWKEVGEVGGVEIGVMRVSSGSGSMESEGK